MHLLYYFYKNSRIFLRHMCLIWPTLSPREAMRVCVRFLRTSCNAARLLPICVAGIRLALMSSLRSPLYFLPYLARSTLPREATWRETGRAFLHRPCHAYRSNPFQSEARDCDGIYWRAILSRIGKKKGRRWDNKQQDLTVYLYRFWMDAKIIARAPIFIKQIMANSSTDLELPF